MYNSNICKIDTFAQQCSVKVTEKGIYLVCYCGKQPMIKLRLQTWNPQSRKYHESGNEQLVIPCHVVNLWVKSILGLDQIDKTGIEGVVHRFGIDGAQHGRSQEALVDLTVVAA